MTASMFAVLAGALTVLNPCGLALLPGLLSLGTAQANSQSGGLSTARALRGGLTLAAGAVAAFSFIALPVALGAQLVAAAIPWLGFTLGVAVAVLALFVLAGKRIALPHIGFGKSRWRGEQGAFLVGAGFGVTTLGCGLPLFLVAVGGAVGARGVVAAVAVVAAFAAGMTVTLVSLMIGLTAVRDRLVQWVSRSHSWMRWINGALLMLAGGYLTYLWATVLFASIETRGRDPLIGAVDRFGLIAKGWLDAEAGATILAAGIAAAAAVVLRSLWRWARTQPTSVGSDCGCEAREHAIRSSSRTDAASPRS